MVEPDTTASFGYWVRRQRLVLDLTQSILAHQVGCATVTISKIEREERRPSRQMAELLADNLSITQEDRAHFIATGLGERAADRMPLPSQPSAPRLIKPDLSPVSNLPATPTPFVGRADELDLLMSRLADPSCRLLTLVGPGGFGKTRLGIRVGELILADPGMAPDGVFFVALDGLESSSWVTPAIADALNLTFHERDDPKSQLVSYLKHKQMLLILDNAEGILDAGLVVNLLRNGSSLKLLVTSREALNIREEWFHPITGMSLGEDDDRIIGGDTRTVDDDAIALFNRCAMRVRPDFEPASEHNCVVTICRSVGGVPLAIELAAAWLKALSCEQVARELEEGIDILTSSMQDVPQRHRSLRDVLEQSWLHLANEERHVFCQLTIFAGGFLPEAALAVIKTSLSVLAGLIDKSILQHGQDGRYRIHPLLRQMGEERLTGLAGERAALAALHSAYYLDFLRNRSQAISGPNQRQVLLEVQAEIDNIRRAWRHAARHRILDGFADALICLFRYLWLRGRFREGEQLFAEALDELAQESMGEDVASLQCTLIARRALFLAATGDTKRATTILRETQLPDASAEISPEKALLLYVTGMIATYDYVPEAYPALSSAYEMYRVLDDRPEIAETGLRLNFIVSWMMGDFAAGRKLVEESLRIYRLLGDLYGVSHALGIRSALLCGYGAYDEAEQDCRDSLRLARDIGSRWSEAHALGGSLLISIGRGQWNLALRHAWDRLAIMQELGHKHQIDLSHAFVGDTYTHACDYENAAEIIDLHPAVRAWPWSEQALIAVGRYAEAMETLPGLTSNFANGGWGYYSVDSLTAWAMLLSSECPLLREGEPFPRADRDEMVRAILSVVRDYDPDRSHAISRVRAAKLLAELDGRGATTDPSAAVAQPATRSAETIAEELLKVRLDKSAE